MRLTKRQTTIGVSVLLLLLAVAALLWLLVPFLRKSADEAGNPKIRTAASATYEVDGAQNTISSSELSIDYEYIEPPVIQSINLENSQVVTTNPYVILVKAANPAEIQKIEFYVDGNLIGTSSLPDIDGFFEGSWDTSLYHSTVLIKVYDIYGRIHTITREAVVDLSAPSPVIDDGINDDADDPNNPNASITPNYHSDSNSYQLRPINNVLPKTGAN